MRDRLSKLIHGLFWSNYSSHQPMINFIYCSLDILNKCSRSRSLSWPKLAILTDMRISIWEARRTSPSVCIPRPRIDNHDHAIGSSRTNAMRLHGSPVWDEHDSMNSRIDDPWMHTTTSNHNQWSDCMPHLDHDEHTTRMSHESASNTTHEHDHLTMMPPFDDPRIHWPCMHTTTPLNTKATCSAEKLTFAAQLVSWSSLTQRSIARHLNVVSFKNWISLML